MITTKVLIPSKIAENSQTTQYNATGVTAIIDKFTATNYSAGPVTIAVNLVTSGDTAGNQNLTRPAFTLQAGQVYTFPELVGHNLAPGSFISTIASAATSINIRCSGREVT